MWPFAKKPKVKSEPKIGDLRVVSKMNSKGEVSYWIQELESLPYSGATEWYTCLHGSMFYSSKEEACRAMRLLRASRDYGTKVEDCNCEAER